MDQRDPSLCVPCFITAKDLGSSQALAHWLQDKLPNLKLNLWGANPGTKRVENLWCELLSGEISIQDSCPPKRTVDVAVVHIQNEAGESLVEVSQELEDGSMRQRNRPLSEKMLPGESVKDACLRGISEELGCERERVVIVEDSYKKEEEENESYSYPGLMTHYVLHHMVAHVQNLPSTEFSTEEIGWRHNEGDAEGAVYSTQSSEGQPREIHHKDAIDVVRHFWRWV